MVKDAQSRHWARATDDPSMLESADITCPYCWETISIDIDASGGSGEYVEDCQVCCHPIRLVIGVDGEGDVATVEAIREND